MPIDDLTALGDALRAARKEKNLTQEQLADESHVSTKQIADIEKARRNPSYLILKALAKVVHLSLGQHIAGCCAVHKPSFYQKPNKPALRDIQLFGGCPEIGAVL